MAALVYFFCPLGGIRSSSNTACTLFVETVGMSALFWGCVHDEDFKNNIYICNKVCFGLFQLRQKKYVALSYFSSSSTGNAVPRKLV